MPTLQQKKEIEDIIATAFKLETTLTKLNQVGALDAAASERDELAKDKF
jgi:hypothetical protein